jgi:hypothetical protein
MNQENFEDGNYLNAHLIFEVNTYKQMLLSRDVATRRYNFGNFLCVVLMSMD